jgi:hypothetical protein
MRAVLFEKRFWDGIRRGEVTLTFRRWKRAQVVAGRVVRSPAGRLHIDEVTVRSEASISDAEAQMAGYPSAEALTADLRGETGADVYRIAFHYLDEPDPRELLAGDDDLDDAAVAAIDRRLARLDAASSHGPWTQAYLEVIATRPQVRAPDLAAAFGRDVPEFKGDVRKLKNLGLTVSLRIGYRLSPRGEAYLRRRRSI